MKGLGEMRLTSRAGDFARVAFVGGFALFAMWALYRGALAFVGVASPARALRGGLKGARRVDRLDGPSSYYLEIDKD